MGLDPARLEAGQHHLVGDVHALAHLVDLARDGDVPVGRDVAEHRGGRPVPERSGHGVRLPRPRGPAAQRGHDRHEQQHSHHTSRTPNGGTVPPDATHEARHGFTPSNWSAQYGGEPFWPFHWETISVREVALALPGWM